VNKLSRVSAFARVAPLMAAVMLAAAACGSGDGSSASSSSLSAAAESVSPAWQKVIDAAKKEGAVTIYSSQATNLLDDLGKKFQAKYGIPVTVNRDIDANLEAKLNAETSSNTPTDDVVALADGAFVTKQAPAGWWSQPTGPAFDVPDYDKAKNLSADGSFLTSAAVFVVGWNTQNVPKGIKSYKDLLDPKLKGHVAVNDPAGSPSTVDFYDYLAEVNGPDYFDKLAAQQPQIFPSVLPAAQALTAGQVWASLAVVPLIDEKDAGAPVDYWVPKPVWGAPFHTAVLAKAPHPNAAQLLADFMVTEEGQAAIARTAASVLPDVGAVTTISNVRAYDPSKLTPEHIAQVRADFKAKFQD
jgi:iron(III) transport system substrate-binding protein